MRTNVFNEIQNKERASGSSKVDGTSKAPYLISDAEFFFLDRTCGLKTVAKDRKVWYNTSKG